MFIKNFLKKKDTYQYLIKVMWLAIILCVINVIMTIIWNSYVIDFNKKYKDYHLEFYADTLEYYDIIETYDNVSDIGIKINVNYDGYYMDALEDINNDLKYNEIIGYYYAFTSNDLGDYIKFEDIDKEFILKEKKKDFTDGVLMNKDAIHDIALDKKDNITYMVYIDDWTKLENVINDINGISDNTLNDYWLEYEYMIPANQLVDNIFEMIFYAFKGVLYTSLIIYLVYLLCGVYAEETKYNYLFYALGFTKGQIYSTVVKKMLIVTVVTLIVFITIFWIFR